MPGARGGSWFRSEPMEWRSIFIREHVAHDCVHRLGKHGIMELTDVCLCVCVCVCVEVWKVLFVSLDTQGD